MFRLDDTQSDFTLTSNTSLNENSPSPYVFKKKKKHCNTDGND